MYIIVCMCAFCSHYVTQEITSKRKNNIIVFFKCFRAFQHILHIENEPVRSLMVYCNCNTFPVCSTLVIVIKEMKQMTFVPSCEAKGNSRMQS